MIEAFVILLKILFYFTLVNLFAGFVRPVFALWFLDRSNRLKVLSIYGSAAVVLFGLIKVMQLLT